MNKKFKLIGKKGDTEEVKLSVYRQNDRIYRTLRLQDIKSTHEKSVVSIINNLKRNFKKYLFAIALKIK